MKTFLVTQKDKPVVINGKNYYYNNIITVSGNEPLDEYKSLVSKGALSYFDSPKFKKRRPNKTKPNNTKKTKTIKTESREDNDKNKNNKKEEK